jgi:alkylhydroperoxidase/carboxymuconolactone decarboxylase family protein YurZ
VSDFETEQVVEDVELLTVPRDQPWVGVTSEEMREAIHVAIRRAVAPLMARIDLLEREMAERTQPP